MLDLLNEFMFLFGELTVLFLGISFLVGIIQKTISEEKIKSMLSTKNKFLGYINALILGTFTPFCSCSTIPVLAGLLKVKAPFGPTMTFLFTSPFLDPSVIALMLALFGVKITVVYSVIVLIFPIVIGVILDKFGFEKYVRDIKINKNEEMKNEEMKNEEGELNLSKKELTKKYLIDAKKEAWGLYISVLPYLIGGVLVGSLMHNVIPQDVITKYVGGSNLWAVPIAAILGIPLYVSSSTILPIGMALAGVGVGLGPIIALIIGGNGASVPEIILLNKIFKKELLVAFVVSIFVIAISAGYLVQFLL